MHSKRWIIFGICTSLFMMSMFYRVSGAIIAPGLSRDLRLSPNDLGLMGAVFFYAFAVVQLPLGILLDRAGARITMAILNTIGVAGAVIFASATGLSVGVAGRALLGVGMAANFMGTLKLITNWFEPERFAALSGLALSIGTIGVLCAATPLALMVEFMGWRGSFYALAGLNGVLALCFLLIVRDWPTEKRTDRISEPEKGSSPSVMASIKTLFSSWNFWAISCNIFCRYGSFAAIQALWAGPFLIEYLGLPSVTAGNLLLMLSIGVIVGAPAAGWR